MPGSAPQAQPDARPHRHSIASQVGHAARPVRFVRRSESDATVGVAIAGVAEHEVGHGVDLGDRARRVTPWSSTTKVRSAPPRDDIAT